MCAEHHRGGGKAALHRGRGHLADPEPAAALAHRTAPGRETIDALAKAFTCVRPGRG
ncbi:hypothetical protein ACFWN5_40985 [Streptomyces sp. NPDC058430]|uniref:hypothetical protein n=1 Tax=Streptomyces sp. NPDC058430 TaxID=3346495 RepID=UPI00365FDDF2